MIRPLPVAAFMGVYAAVGTLAVAMNPDKMPGMTTIKTSDITGGITVFIRFHRQELFNSCQAAPMFARSDNLEPGLTYSVNPGSCC